MSPVGNRVSGRWFEREHLLRSAVTLAGEGFSCG